MTTLSGILADMAELFRRTSLARQSVSPRLAGRLAEGLGDLAAEARRLEASERQLVALCAEPAEAEDDPTPAARGVVIDLSEILGRERPAGPGRTGAGDQSATIIPLMAVHVTRHPAGGEPS